MDSIIITWRELLLVLAAVLAVYVAEMLLLLRRNGNAGWRLWQRGAQAHAQARALAEVRAQVEAMRIELEQMRERLRDSSQSRSGTSVRPGSDGERQAPNDRGSPPLPPSVEADTPYGQAIRMAREGRAVVELASECGISRGEAELIVALYRSSSTH